MWKACNPLGTLYNPLSIAEALDMMLNEEKGAEIFESTLFQANNIWNSNKFDSSFSSTERSDCIQEFTERQQILIENLTIGQQLIITFGTSYAYYLVGEDTPVGNCHKLPASLFHRKRLSIEEIYSIWTSQIERLKKRFPDIRIIFTVSPVRHLKDGFTGNSRSKAVLMLAIEEILKKEESCLYFPAFEILNDDLRDYRFYASDLAHPSNEAIDYVWEKFLDTFVDPRGRKFLEEGSRTYKAIHHLPKLGALGKKLNP